MERARKGKTTQFPPTKRMRNMKMRITVEGKAYDVEVEILEESGAVAPATPPVAKPAAPSSAPAQSTPAPAKATGGPAPSASGNSFPSPLAGTVKTIKVSPGDKVTNNQEIMILEAMKMETSVYSPKDGVIKAVPVSVGQNVQSGTPLVEFE